MNAVCLPAKKIDNIKCLKKINVYALQISNLPSPVQSVVTVKVFT